MNHEKGLYFHDRDSLANKINNVPAYYDLSAELIADEIFNNKENTLQVSAADADVIAEHLRQIAESVDREEWDVLDNSDADYQVIVSGSLERGTTYRSYQPVANGISEQKIAAFIAAFNPKVALALLDKNLQLQREKDAIEAVALALRDDMRHAREQLEAAEKRIAEQREYYEGVIADGSKRIAELERSETQLISERDDAESALNDAYKAVMGQAPEWSNWFSFENAIDEIELACELWRNQTDDVIQFRQRIADLETQKADLMEHVLNGYEATALTMTLRKMNSYLPDYLRFCGIYGVEHDAIIDKLDYQSFVLKRLKNGDLRQDIEAGTGKEEQV